MGIPVELKGWLENIDLFQALVAAFIVIYIINVLFNKFLPSVALLSKMVDSVKDLPEDIPKLKKELEDTKKKVANIEARLDALVDDNLLPKEGELNGDCA